MSKEKIIQKVRQKMGEPLVKHLTDEDYNNGYDLVEKIMVNTKLNKEFGTEVCNLLHRRMLETICKENILNQNKDEDRKRS